MANPEDLGRYRLKRLLGRGALGQVWEADDLGEEGTKVVVKIMHAADEELAFARTLFARDAQLASVVGHPHVAAVFDAGEAAGTSFMVMEHIEGRSLRAALADAAITDADKLRWLRQIGEALAAMHGIGLAHRDLKPENVIIRPDGSACVVDLGIAKWIRVAALEMREQWRTEDAFVPPEAADGLYDELSDQYAWATLGYEMFAGAGQATALPEREALPAEAAAALARARAPARSERWGSMARALAGFSDGLLAAAPAEATPTSPTADADPAAGPVAAPGAERDDGAQAAATAQLAEPAAGARPRQESTRSPVVLGVGALALLVLAALALTALR